MSRFICPLCHRPWADPSVLRTADYDVSGRAVASEERPRPTSRTCRTCDVAREKDLWAKYIAQGPKED